jgi:hypothetical protein
MLLDILSRNALFGVHVFMLLLIGAAWMTGRSIAGSWKPTWNLAASALGLGFAARFLHFALYQAPFLSLSRYTLDTLTLGVVAYLGHRFTRTNQMTRQYHWLYDKASPFSWRSKT